MTRRPPRSTLFPSRRSSDLSDTPNSTNFTIEGRPVTNGAESIEVPLDAVTTDYFKTMGIALLKGRVFDERDRIGSLPVRSEEHTSELQSQFHLVCRLLLEKK